MSTQRVIQRGSVRLPRVTVNPNRVTRKNPAWTVVGMEELDRPLSVGDKVIADQPDDEGGYVSTAVVEEINEEYSLVYLSVDWAGFHVEAAAPASMSSGVWRRQTRERASRGALRRVRVVPVAA